MGGAAVHIDGGAVDEESSFDAVLEAEASAVDELFCMIKKSESAALTFDEFKAFWSGDLLEEDVVENSMEWQGDQVHHWDRTPSCASSDSGLSADREIMESLREQVGVRLKDARMYIESSIHAATQRWDSAQHTLAKRRDTQLAMFHKLSNRMIMSIVFHAILVSVTKERCRLDLRGRLVKRVFIYEAALAFQSWHTSVLRPLAATRRLQRAHPGLASEQQFVLHMLFSRWRGFHGVRSMANSLLAAFATSEQSELLSALYFVTWRCTVLYDRIEAPRAEAPTPASPPGAFPYVAGDEGDEFPTLGPQSLAASFGTASASFGMGQPLMSTSQMTMPPVTVMGPTENDLELESLVFEAARQVVPREKVQGTGPGSYKIGDFLITIQKGEGKAGDHHAFAKRGREWVLLTTFLEELFPAAQQTSTPPRSGALTPRTPPRSAITTPRTTPQTTPRPTVPQLSLAKSAPAAPKPTALAKPGLIATAKAGPTGPKSKAAAPGGPPPKGTSSPPKATN